MIVESLPIQITHSNLQGNLFSKCVSNFYFATCVVAMQVIKHLHMSSIFELQILHAILLKDFVYERLKHRWVAIEMF